MGEILSGYLIEIIFALFSSLVFWVIHHLSAEIKKYKELLDKQENEVLENILNTKLAPIENSLQSINTEVGNIKKQNAKYYATLLQHDCENYLNKGSVNQQEFNKTSELLHIYEGLGGNGRIHDLWAKVLQLPMKD